MNPFLRLVHSLLAAAVLLACASATANEAAIRKALSERYPQLKIDEVSRTPFAGLWEVRFDGAEILYSDATGDHILVGAQLVDTRNRTDLTAQRLEQLLAVDWAQLPLADAIVIRQGNGSRKVAVFGDPNCGFCKRFERDLAGARNVTVYSFVLPILGPDSISKARDIWCSRDPGTAWRRWMLEGVQPARAPASCNSSAIDRNVAFARAHRINGTPVTFFEGGKRESGAIPASQIETLLSAAPAKK